MKLPGGACSQTDAQPGLRPDAAAAVHSATAASGHLPEPAVQAMFDRIAGVYDLLNQLMTAGLHHRWRERAVQLAGVSPGACVLDVATGTGDLALALARAAGPRGRVVAVDFSERMLDLATAKDSKHRRSDDVLAPIDFCAANALSLPFEDSRFDAATVGFGVRNFADLRGGLTELVRVVAPGGRVVVLEMTVPRRPPLSRFFSLWFDRIVPLLGRLAGDAEAYTYLPRSVRRFPGPQQLAELLYAVGLRDVGWVITGGGIIAIHHGRVGKREQGA